EDHPGEPLDVAVALALHVHADLGALGQDEDDPVAGVGQREVHPGAGQARLAVAAAAVAALGGEADGPRVQAGDLGERRPRQEPAGDEAGLVLRTEETVVTGAFAVVQQLAHTGLVRGDGPAYGALELLGRGRLR